VAGWKPKGNAQLLYVKEAFKAQLSGNGLVTGAANKLLKNADKTEVFHKIKTP